MDGDDVEEEMVLERLDHDEPGHGLSRHEHLARGHVRLVVLLHGLRHPPDALDVGAEGRVDHVLGDRYVGGTGRPDLLACHARDGTYLMPARTLP
ncbi:hypothetical protein G3I77_25715 [Streptomyces sp. D2-8]|nr:hypothetical protein [Streptomyces sp. D2-8]